MNKELVYALYGNYNWPPTPANRSSGDSKQQQGCVLIGYADHPDGSEVWAAWMAWVPSSDFKIDDQLNEVAQKVLSSLGKDSENIYLDPSDGSGSWSDYFKKNGNRSIAMWLNRPSGGVYEEKLGFWGSFLFESYDDSGKLESWWPLILDTKSGEVNDVSGVVFGNKSPKDIMSLCLGVPLLGWELSGDAAGARSFPMRFEHDHAPTKKIKDFRQIRSTYLGFGYHPESQLQNDNLPKYINRRIGGFGFTVKRESGERQNYANLFDKDYIKKYFPLGNGDLDKVSGLLQRFGLSIPDLDEFCFDYPERNEANAHALSLSFGKSVKAGKQYSVINYRLQVKPTRKNTAGVANESDLTNVHNDIAVISGNTYVRLEKEIGKWLKLEAPLTFSFSLTVSTYATPRDVFDQCSDGQFSSLYEALGGECSVSADWDATDPDGKVGRGEIFDAHTGPAIEHYGTLDGAIMAMRSARFGLQQIEGSQPQSFLPELKIEPNSSSVTFSLESQDLKLALHQDRIDWRNEAEDMRFRLSLAKPLSNLKGEPHRIQFKAWLPSLGGGKTESIALVFSRDDNFLQKKITDKFAAFEISVVVEKGDLSFSLAALKFDLNGSVLSNNSEDDQEYSRLQVSRARPDHILINDSEVANKAVIAPLGVDLKLRFSVNSVTPVTVGIPRGDVSGREVPLIIHENPGKGDKSENYVLAIHEKLQSRRDWHLSAQLLDKGISSEAIPDSFVVFSTQPFSLLRFKAVPLNESGDEETIIVAEFDSLQRVWVFKDTSEGYYRYTLPAQVIGEGADKPRRNEIHDLDLEEDDSGRPYPPVDLAGENATYLVDYRLTPPTEVWVKPSDLTRSYLLAPWAAHDLFRQKNDFGLGMALLGLRGEFLYGLTVGIDPKRESGPAALARIAEIEALTGQVSAQYSTEDEDPLSRRWSSLVEALKDRSERLELWVEEPNSVRPFAPAKFSSGASFTLRNTALHRPPVPMEGSYISKSDEDEELLPRYHEQGLSGGALWPLESQNFFEALRNNPDATGGSIEGVALSPFGGDADQSAEFLNGNVKIISQTRNGRVQRQRVEIMGRVAALWHHAKHVIVYERTVNASDQFAPEKYGKTRTRRPVLRKVSEYVELLEPLRRYPDFEEAESLTCACLRGVRFNSKRINVDSAWSEDVGGNGWSIPLWNRYSSRIRPNVYPRPDVAFLTSSEGEGERPEVAQECLDPENIYFYAEATDNSDTDSWRSRCGMDFCNAPDASVVLGALNDASADADAGKIDSPRSANASRILPGYRRFTWKLAPAAQRTQINAGRGQKPIYAGLETITFMRSSTPIDKDSDLKCTNLIAESWLLKSKLNDVNAQVLWTSKSAPSEASKAKKNLESLIEILKSANPSQEDAKTAFDALKTEIDSNGASSSKLSEALFGKKSIIKGNLEQIKKLTSDRPDNDNNGKTIPGLSSHAKTILDGVGSLDAAERKCERIAENAVGGLKRKKRLILENIRTFQNELDQKQIPKTIKTKAAFIDWVTPQLVKELDVALDPARADVGNLKSGIETAYSIIGDTTNDFEQALKNAKRRFEELVASYDNAKPWSDARVEELVHKLSNDIDGLWQDIDAAVDEARQRFATELDDTAQRVGMLSAQLLSEVASSEFQSLATVSSGHAAIRSAAEKANQSLDKSEETIDQAIELLTNAYKKKKNPKIEAAIKELGRYKLKVAKWRSSIGNVNPRSSIDLLNKKIKESAKDLSGSIVIIRDSLVDNIDLVGVFKEQVYAEFKDEFNEYKQSVVETINELDEWVAGNINKIFERKAEVLDPVINEIKGGLSAALVVVGQIGSQMFAEVDEFALGFQKQFNAMHDALWKGKDNEPSAFASKVGESLFEPAVDFALSGIKEEKFEEIAVNFEEIKNALLAITGEVEEKIEELDEKLLGSLKELTEACKKICQGVKSIQDRIEKEAQKYLKELEEEFKRFLDAEIGDTEKTIKEIIDGAASLKDYKNDILNEVQTLDRTARSIVNDATSSVQYARAYADRVLDKVGKLDDGGFASVPSNILRLYSAATSAPELASLQANVDRLRLAFKEGEDFIRSSKAKVLLSRLGDELKAMGLDLPFDRIAGDFKIDTGALDFNSAIRNFGGLKLGGLFEGARLPEDINQYIDISHDFDKAQARAWVQVAMNMPLRGSYNLFQIGPFRANFVNTRMRGRMRLEASKDTDSIEQTGMAIIGTDIDLEVSGQMLVRLQKVAIRYSKERGMDFEFDPKNIRLNPSFQFVQDTLGSIFPGELGGMQVIKENGIPVGLEHLFKMPPISLNFGTSGVSNIEISNRFKLLAYPDFILADQFNLSRVDKPFIFSIFIIGGTGYIEIDTEYRPFDKELSVSVEAAAGGSAALAFSVGPVAGGVYMTFSVALRYQKRIGRTGGGLSVSQVLVVGGHVSLWGMATVFLSLTLRMSYHSSGKIDASGRLKVKLKVSRFFTLKFRRSVTYQLREGKSSRRIEQSTSTEIDPKVKEKAERLKKLREQL